MGQKATDWCSKVLQTEGLSRGSAVSINWLSFRSYVLCLLYFQVIFFQLYLEEEVFFPDRQVRCREFPLIIWFVTNSQLLDKNEQLCLHRKTGRDGEKEDLEEMVDRGGQRKRSWKEDGAEAHGLEELQVAWEFLYGEECDVEAYLPNIGT